MDLPKISQFTKVLATPEEYLENIIKSTMGVEVPPGPQSVLLKIQTAIEKGEMPSIERFIPTIKAPRLQDILSSIPKIPEIQTEVVQKTEEIQKVRKEETIVF
ncbi:MAG: hypothetical protein QW803_12170 [Candidatus Methanomethylicia archaeon]